MKCVICKKGKTRAKNATITLPDEVCEVCGEEHVSEETTASLLETAKEAAEAGVRMDIREYVAA